MLCYVLDLSASLPPEEQLLALREELELYLPGLSTRACVIVANKADVTDAAADRRPEGEISADIWQPWTKAVAEATGAKGRGLFMPLRLALTGREKGPEIAPLLAFIGRDRIIARLRGESA